MYNTHYTCFYHDDEKMFSNKDKLTPEEKEEIKDLIYKEDLLNAFGINEFNDIIINEIDNLYNSMKYITELHPILETLASQIMSTDRSAGFVILFSYDYFYLTHQIICEFLNDTKIDNNKIIELTNLVNN
jgi:hypothetical protein